MKGFISRPRLAALLDMKTASLGARDRHGKGVGGRGPIYLGATKVVYRLEDAERFLESLGVSAPAFLNPQERGAVRWPAAPRPDKRGVRPQRPAATSDLLKAPSEDESAPNVAPEREG